jgi:hypothetical protein
MSRKTGAILIVGIGIILLLIPKGNEAPWNILIIAAILGGLGVNGLLRK